MSNLQQLQVSYEQVQDRLVLTIATADLQEYRFWITRRATKMLWIALVKLLKADQRDELEKMKTNEQVIRQIQQERARRNASANKFATPIAQQPLGEEPMLLFGVRAKPPTDENPSIALQLEDDKGRSLQIAGDSSILLALCQLLKETSALAEWNLDLKIEGHKEEIQESKEKEKSARKKQKETE